MNGKILTRREVSAYLKISERSIDRLKKSGKLKGFHVGGTAAVRYWEADLAALLT
jgi:hypothetical protein